MILAIDYDSTYTLDSNFWDHIISLFLERGHTVICVTGRSKDGVMDQPVLNSIGKLVPVIFAGPDWKRDATLKRGYKVDVWVDDMPEMIAKQNLIGR